MQPKIKAKVSCTDRVVGEISRVIVDPVTKEISHLVVRADGKERLVATDEHLESVTEDGARLRCPSEAFYSFELFRRDDFVEVKEVEIAQLERRLDVVPGETLVPIPEIEKDIERRTFLQRFTHVIGAAIALPMVYPILRYILHPMYRPLDNSWLKFGKADQVREIDFPKLVKFEKDVQEGFLERTFTKSHWAMKASPEALEKIYNNKDLDFKDKQGNLLWVNKHDEPIVVFSGKCPHLGCAYRLRKHRRFGQAFICPCHLTAFALTGAVLDGPSPRPLDILPSRVNGRGEIEIIDMEFKAGKEDQIRIA